MYYVGKNGQQTGPFTLDQIKAKYASGEILPTDLVWKEGTADWKPASTFSELAAPEPTPAASPSFSGPSSIPVSSTTVDPSPTVLPPASAFPGAPTSPGYPMPGPVGPKQNPMAITGLVMGIMAILTTCCCYGVPFNLLGIVFSIIGLAQIKNDPVNQLGKPLALAGLILSIASIVIVVILLILGVTLNFEDIRRQIEAQQSGAR